MVFFSSRRRHTRWPRDWSSDVCSSDLTRKGLGSAIERATVEVGRPTFFSMLIIIAAHIPIFTLQCHEGRIFAPMAWTVTSALVGSLLFSLTLVQIGRASCRERVEMTVV